MKEIITVEEGQEFPFENIDLHNDGAILELPDETNGFLFIVGFTDMKEKEVENLKEGEIEFRYIENENFMFPLIKLGDSIFEWIFNPFVYPNEKDKLEKINEYNLVNLIGYDRRDRTVKVVRSFSINEQLRQKWIEKMDHMEDLNQREIRFNSFISSIHSHGTVAKLWDDAEKI